MGMKTAKSRETAVHVAFVAASLAVTAALYVYSQLMVPAGRIDDMLEVEIPKGSSFREAVVRLGEHGLLKDRSVFIALGRITGLDKKLTPGYYRFYGSPSPWDVFGMLRNGHVVQWHVTVVEGDTLREIGEKLAAEGIMSRADFERLVTDQEFMRSLGVLNAPSLEGYLFPDTYSFSKSDLPEDVLGVMVRRLWKVYDEDLRKRTAELGMTENEVLTLASIIEKEAILDNERPVISSVYHNRLRIGMPLQADPTSIYGIKPQSKGITRRDIRRKTDYNTYHIKGLPPGPIASPGEKSIRAALWPAKSPYLYFVANYRGGHTFSVTHEEHTRAIQEYRKKKYAALLQQQQQQQQQAERPEPDD